MKSEDFDVLIKKIRERISVSLIVEKQVDWHRPDYEAISYAAQYSHVPQDWFDLWVAFVLAPSRTISADLVSYCAQSLAGPLVRWERIEEINSE